VTNKLRHVPLGTADSGAGCASDRLSAPVGSSLMPLYSAALYPLAAILPYNRANFREYLFRDCLKTLELPNRRPYELPKNGAQRACSCSVALPKLAFQRPPSDFSDGLSTHPGE
jgi:hypothetical protein